MLFMRLLAVFVSCSLIVVGQSGAQNTRPQDQQQKDWRFAHPDALLVGAIHPKALVESPVMEELLKQWGPKDASAAQTAAMLGMAKGLLSGINEIRFSLTQTATNEPGKPKTDVVALVDGHFDESVLALIMANQASNPDKPGFRRVDPNTLLIGKSAALDQAAQRMMQSEPKLRSRAFEGTETLASNDIWISGQVPENPFALLTDGMPLPGGLKPPTIPELSKSLRRIAFGLSLREGIDGELVLQTATAEMAQALVKEALKSIEEKPNAMSRLIGARAEGTTAHFTLNVPRSIALESIRAAMAQSKSLAANTAAPQPLDAPTPVRHTVVIEGLDEGTREVPLTQQTR
jgi:hypothetical protein